MAKGKATKVGISPWNSSYFWMSERVQERQGGGAQRKTNGHTCTQEKDRDREALRDRERHTHERGKDRQRAERGEERAREEYSHICGW